MDRVSQLIAAGIANGSGYALLGLAFGLIYAVTKRFHYALSLTFVTSALTTSILTSVVGVPLIVGVVSGLAAGVLSGYLMERWMYRPIAAHSSASSSGLNVFVASLGIAIAGENIIRLLAGSATRSIPVDGATTLSFGSVRLGAIDVALIVVTAVMVGAVSALLTRSRFGRSIRATRSNEELAGLLGIRTTTVYLLVFALGSGIVAIAGIFDGARFAVLPDMGLRPVFYAFVVAFLAKPHAAPWRFWVVGLAIGVAESILGLWMPAALSQVAVFGTLFVIVAGRALTPVIDRVRIRTGAPRSAPTHPAPLQAG